MSQPDLARIRTQIDEIDGELVRLLSRRAELAIEIGAIKGRDGKPFFTPEREREIFEKLDRTNPGPLQTKQLAAIFREIISAARAAEKPLFAAYWGPPGTFTHLAAVKTFGESSTLVPVESIEEVFRSVEHGQADYGVVPIENSVAGIVPETLDMFPNSSAKICAETYISVHHHLVTACASLAEIERVYTGPQPEHQCRGWLRQHLPRVEIVNVAPTAKAAAKAKEDSRGAAIANAMAAELTGLPILVEHIEDNPHNQTRFLIVGYNEPARTGKDKTSLRFTLGNRPGELYAALGAFDRFGVNLMMIESRRARAFDYNFFLDCVGHRTDENVKSALEALGALSHDITILGSYPMSDMA
ncbi:MAG TPA: prephenate dehydratase [Fimbriimonadaceae bacterium]|nr:prephenate dehydratase [Fimbriimonadaceae bacterium]